MLFLLEMVASRVSESLFVVRKDIDPYVGYERWKKFQQREFVSLDFPLGEARIQQLRRRTALELGTLNRSDYLSFCNAAHAFARLQNSESLKQVADVFADLPTPHEVRKQYSVEAKTLGQKHFYAVNLEDRLTFVVGGLAFLGGAVLGGAIGEYIAEMPRFQDVAHAIYYPSLLVHSERLASAVGGILGGLSGILGTSRGLRVYVNHLHYSEKELDAKIQQDFTNKVQDYIRTYGPML